MTLIYLIIGGVVGIIVGRSWAKRRGELSAANTEMARRREEGKMKIMNLVSNKLEISNNDVEHMLGVSDATATNYLSELEAGGKIVQVGTTGNAVRYRRH